jgi:hypothetical protein
LIVGELGVLSFLAAVVIHGLISPPQAAASGDSTLGVYIGSGNVTALKSFTQNLGEQPTYVQDFLPSGSWPILRTLTITLAHGMDQDHK